MACILIGEGLAKYEDFEFKSHHQYLNDWTPRKSTFKLVCILCLPQLKESLESIRLVACKTDEMEAIGCNLARQGKLIELASLLMVAPEKLIVTTSPGSKDLCSNAIRRCIMSDLQVLLDSEDGRRSRLKIVGEIQNLLEKAGFAMKHNDINLNGIKCFSPTMDPVDYPRLPSALLPHQFSVAERGSRSFHMMVLGNLTCRDPRVSTLTGISTVSGKNRRWFLSLGVAITNVIKRV
ncbi:hypothetical protein V6N11_010030 [Hibiscus sabdariffa]|uniref:Uncharacterized protein n=1 Tax=Hibiscus sabdariffa TaxID=183260 RepID=A0ABR2PDH4_9ROSI